ncbi:MAG: DUF2325 domain-containing protein [Pseudomonadota bacterium]|nr:DUF2325 domain-containing protein [Pseudomonadota bacterium]
MNMFVEALSGSGGIDAVAYAPQRKKIWEMDQVFRCPVVGMCLSVKEQRLLCRKAGAGVQVKSDFGIHEMIVATMTGENPLSRKLENMLAKKYEASCSIYLDMAEADFLDCWHRALESGDYGGLLWAAAVRPLSNTALVDVFGSLHMAMHEHAKMYCDLKKAREAAEEKYLQLKGCVRENEKQRRMLHSENEQLRESLARTREQLEELRHERDDAVSRIAAAPEEKSGPAQIRMDEIQEEIAALKKQVEEKDLELLQLTGQFLDLEEERDSLREEVEAHRAVAAAMREAVPEAEAPEGCSCSPDCPSYDLCKKRILIVGGIERMESAYRKLVEERGGILEYHAGHMKSGGRALENSVQRADLVLCPVNCNSHGACLMVKNLGKKYKKPVHMLPNFSLSTLARTVEEIHSTN